MTVGPEQPKKPPASGSQLRGAIDAGKTRDKVPGSDPAASPLGTDDEASGTPITPQQLDAAIRQETGRGAGVPPEPANTTTGTGSRTFAYMAGAILILVLLVVIAL